MAAVAPASLAMRAARVPRSRPQFSASLSRRRHARFLSTTPSLLASQTLTEKIVQRYAVDLPEGKLVRSGDYISLAATHLMTHDNTAAVINKFESMGATKIHTPAQIVTTLDHDIQNVTPANLQKYDRCAAFAKKHGIVHYKAGRGIGHQIMVEEGYAWPGTLAVASDSHSVHYGAMGCLGTPVVRTDAASIYATSRTWWQVPPVARVTFVGTLPPGVTGKDVIVALCGLFPSDVLNHAVEFTGSKEAMESLSIDYRTTIANMSCEWGALSGLFPIDDTLVNWLRDRADAAAKFGSDRTTSERVNHKRIDETIADPVTADSDAVYAKQLYLDLSTLSPHVSGPNSTKISTPLNELTAQKIKVDKAYIVSCTNSRASDIAEAAKVFKDAAKANPGVKPKIADGLQLYIAAASAPEQATAEAAGDWQVLLDAGAIPLPSGCGPCIGLGTGLLESGEVGISASNRNYSGRMGSREASAYLASPEVVAASALNGIISGPAGREVPADWSGIKHGYGTGPQPTTEDALSGLLQQLDSLIERVESATEGSEAAATEILPGFPEKISGEIVFCDADNLNTDGIYSGKLTYQENVSKEDMARACMANYDPGFDAIAKPSDILVSGSTFGCGSSREQAATAILAKGIPLVVASSFGNIFSRNSINNALMTVELPRLIERLRATFPDKVPTRRTGWTLTWDLKRSTVEVKEGETGETWSEKVGDLPTSVQAIIAAGGLEAWCKAEIAKQ